MPDPTRKIVRELAMRVVGASVAAAVITGLLVYRIERAELEHRVRERVAFAARDIRDDVSQAAALLGRPWEEVVGQLVDRHMQYQSMDLGRFLRVTVYDAEGQRRAAWPMSSGEPPQGPARPSTIPTGDGIRLTLVDHGTEMGAVAFVAPEVGEYGHLVGTFEGVYEIAPTWIEQAWLQVVRAVLASVIIVLATALLIFPLVRHLVRRLSDFGLALLEANLDILRVLGSAIAKRDGDTDGHNYRVTLYAVRLAEAVGLDAEQVRGLMKGAFLHDVGKIAVPDRILHKPGRLDADELAVMKTHVDAGLEIAAAAHWLRDAREVIGGHHEQFGGGGYRAGLKGADIPFGARLFAICDVFDALTSRRPYKEAMPLDAALRILDEGAGRHFDPELVVAFRKIAPALLASYGANDDHARAEVAALA